MRMVMTRCAQGTLEGLDERGVLSFLGVPYATDGGRFKPAGAAKAWEGTRDATQVAPVFPQRVHDFALPGPDGPVPLCQREDAFVANVWTPALAGTHPVLLWIHGGRWAKGSCADPAYSGATFAASHDVVVVSVNYRLGALANLDLPGISEGNLAVGDLLAALRWAHANAAAFGGDAANITLAGQSAGAWYAAVLAGMPQADGLFDKLMLMSAPAPAMLTGRDTRKAARLLLEELGIATSPERIYDIPISRMLEAQAAIEQAMGGLGMQFAPIETAELQLGDVYARAAARLGAKPLLNGVTAQEAAFFLASRMPAVPLPLYQLVERIGSRVMFAAACDKLAASCENAYGYRVQTGSSNKRVQACHCADLPLLFGNFDVWAQDPLYVGTDMSALEGPSQAFRTAVSAFMRTGNPSCGACPDWPVFRNATDRVAF